MFLRSGARRCGGFGFVFVRRQEIAELAGGGRQRHGFPRNNRVTYRAPPVAFCPCRCCARSLRPEARIRSRDAGSPGLRSAP
ncbi:hypothetical protein BWU74_13370 [Paraburkholderia caledonica]|nr:hypothetical protein BWU74_13370 [Burkholderia sp. Bk]